MSGYTTVWERRPSFEDDGKRCRSTDSLSEARLIMQMAFMTEPEFRPIQIVDSTGKAFEYELRDPMLSDQDYVNQGFEYTEEWKLRIGDDHRS